MASPSVLRLASRAQAIRMRPGCKLLRGKKMKRYGMTIRLRAGSEDAYKRYHAAVWPEVLEMIQTCHIKNYSIYLHDGVLFSYFEYHGDDFAADMARMAAHAKTQEWWAIMQPMQNPLATRKPHEWWTEMEEVFHMG